MRQKIIVEFEAIDDNFYTDEEFEEMRDDWQKHFELILEPYSIEHKSIWVTLEEYE